MEVHNYRSSSGKDLIFDYLDSLDEKERVDGYSVIECMEMDRMEEISIKPWQDRIMEAYFYKHNRLFYVVVEGTDLYILHACRKQKNRTEKLDKKIVINRAKELGKQLGRKFVK